MPPRPVLIPKKPDDVKQELVGDFLAIPGERVASMAERFAGFEIRQPTLVERLRWLETLRRDTADHQRHALKVIDAIAQDDAAFSVASADLRTGIEAALGSVASCR